MTMTKMGDHVITIGITVLFLTLAMVAVVAC